MKRIFIAATFLIALFSVVTGVKGQTQDSGLLMLSKNFNGTVSRSAVEIGLSANADCDQTKDFIPDGSKLMTQNFALNADSNGVGTFTGTAYVVTPAGRVVLSGSLKGTVGINTRCGTNKSCRLPWHLEGLFESTPSTSQRAIVRAASDVKIAPMVLNFSGDLNPQTASPLPIYQGRLDGLVPALPASIDRITVGQDKPSYVLNDMILTTVVNDSPETIQTWDKRSFCSIAQLQVLDGNQWNDTGFCPLKAASFPVNIPPRSKLELIMNPTQTIEPLKPGVYRIALTFRFVSENIPLSDSFVVYSQEFRMAAQPPSNQVIINTSKPAYVEQEAVLLRVNNDTAQNVVAFDHQSFCTIITVQRQEGGDWVNVFPCLLATPSRPVKISSRENLEIKLPTDDAASKLPAGNYRLLLTHWNVDASGNTTGNPTNTFSATFSVSGK